MTSDVRRYSSKDVQEVAGLTPRQQNDWDSRGVLPHERTGEEGWRRYSLRQIFVLLVCAEIRRQYGTPVERLKWMQEVMLAPGANHFAASVEMMATLGVGVWLCTDLEETFIVDSELEFTDLWENGYFAAGNEQALLFLPVNPLVNKLLGRLKEPVELKGHGRGYEIMRAARAMHQVRSPEEALVLEKLRSGEFLKVEVEMPGGSIKTIRTTSRPDPTTRLSELLDGEPYQTLTVTMKDGRVISIKQEATIQPDHGPNR